MLREWSNEKILNKNKNILRLKSTTFLIDSQLKKLKFLKNFKFI